MYAERTYISTVATTEKYCDVWAEYEIGPKLQTAEKLDAVLEPYKAEVQETESNDKSNQEVDTTIRRGILLTT